MAQRRRNRTSKERATGAIVPPERIDGSIFLIRGQKVLLDTLMNPPGPKKKLIGSATEMDE